MLIEKRKFSGGMNGDVSERELPDTDSLNIMNCRNAVTKEGRLGRLENVAGTTQVTDNIRPPYGTSQTIGTAIDFESMRLLIFNYNTSNDHWIACYDPSANNAAGKLYAVIYDSQVIGGLNFSRDSLIHSARVQNGNLYWVDSTNNEPRRLDINAAIEMNLGGTFPTSTPYSYPMTQSVIRMIRRQPGLPLTGTKATDTLFLNNFTANEAFQFQWRYIYRGYEVSTLSALSLLTNYNISTDTFNYVAITAPLDETIDQDVLQVDFVAKYLNGGKSFIIHSWNRNITADLTAINAHNAGTTALTFNFYNDFTGIALDDAYSVKPFDSLPIYAQTIEMARFRSFLGNYTIGYDTPTTTSLTVTQNSSNDTLTVTGKWIRVTYNSGATTIYFIQIVGSSASNGFYSTGGAAPPAVNVAFGTLTFVTQYESAFWSSLPATYPNITFANYTGDTSTIIGGTAPVGLTGTNVFKTGASYQLAVSFLDHAGRKCGILTKAALKTTITNRLYSQTAYVTSLQWTLSNTDAVNEIPDWASYVSINITRNQNVLSFLQLRAKNITYATKDANGAYVFNNAAYSTTRNGIGIDITSLNSYAMGYVFEEGDLVNVYIGTSVYQLTIIGQDGNWIVCQLQNIGAIGNTATPFTTSLFQIYTPYKPSFSEPYWEVAQIYPIDNPGQSNRQYSVISGQILGDTVLLTRNDGTADYRTENMSPNDKFYTQWNMSLGRPNYVDIIGQVVKESSIAYSNTFIPGSKVNGLSTYDALDTKDIQCGAISKLQNANKTGEDQGDIMLAICISETASLYLGEVQLVGQASNAFIAQAPNVIGTVNVLKGSLGTTRPESVSFYKGLVFAIDLNKGVFWQYSPSGLEEVSRYKQTRFFKNYCDDYLASVSTNLDNINGFHHIRSSISPFYNEVQVTLPALIYESEAAVLPSYTPTGSSLMVVSFQAKFTIGGFANKFVFSLLNNPTVGDTTYVRLIDGNGVVKIYSYTAIAGNTVTDVITALNSIVNADIYFTSATQLVFPTIGLSIGQVTANNQSRYNGSVTIVYANTVPSYASSIINRFDIYDQLNKIMCFQFERNTWGNNFEWNPEWTEYLQNSFYGFKDGRLYIFDSDNDNWNTVFGVQYPMRICTTGNLNASNLKDLYNIAIEGDGTIPDYVVALTAIPNQQITDLASTDVDSSGNPIWANNESICDAAFLADRLSPNSTGTAEQKLFTGDQLVDFVIFVQVEFNTVYDRLLFVQYINIGYDSAKGESNITRVINA